LVYYKFTDLMGPKVFDLPILLALAYMGMGYLSWVLAVVILDCQNEPLSGRKIVLLPLAASFVMTAWDLPWDAVRADIDHAWVWRDGRLVLWSADEQLLWLVSHCLHLLSSYSRCISETECIRIADKSLASRDLVLCHIRSGESPGCGSLVLPESSWMPRADTGHPRHSFGISLVSIFLMMPLSLMLWVKASGPVEPFSKQVALGIPSE